MDRQVSGLSTWVGEWAIFLVREPGRGADVVGTDAGEICLEKPGRQLDREVWCPEECSAEMVLILDGLRLGRRE